MLRRMAGIWLGAKPQLRIRQGDVWRAGPVSEGSLAKDGARRAGYLARR